ncbi:Phosphomethylpyrimidine synthase ThiC [hydrothermal vent metagenome]|uniref:Phosphomethylpyrimidine synthase ThiC n=1 Tax=hydrothermal vent metagenome TaxID=652676 RepID=A0A3B1C180_9ZZZZ
MPTQLASARRGEVTETMELLAKREGVEPTFIRDGIYDGSIVITKNNTHKIDGLAIGAGLKTKVNANIGSSRDDTDISNEIEKMQVAITAGADAIMDLSTGGDIPAIRSLIMTECSVPVGTVPIYEVAAQNVAQGKHLLEMTADDLFAAIENHGRDGVDFVTVHCGITKESVSRMKNEGRLLDIVSRGGAIHAKMIEYHGDENPLYEHYDRLVDICREYDMTLSLGDGMRPGCLADATDKAQVQETIILGELAKRARDRDVQVMIEGPGHMPLDQIEANIKLQKRLCNNAPFYVLGPLVTDIAPGYDHITSAIGGAIAASAGADFLCYVTPAEHLRLPTVEDVREGVMAARIAGHAADIAKGVSGARDKDDAMARARKELDWETQFNICIDPKLARARRAETNPEDDDVCTMCAALCSIKTGTTEFGQK